MQQTFYRYPLEAAFTEQRRLVGNLSREARALYVGVQSPSQHGTVHFRLELTRAGITLTRRFSLGTGQDVVVDVTGTTGTRVWMESSDIVDATGGSVAVAAWTEEVPDPSSPHEAFLAGSYAGGAAAVALHDVPPGAVELEIISGVSQLRWVVYSGSTAKYLPGSCVTGAVTPVRGTRIEVPAGETLEAAWRIAL